MPLSVRDQSFIDIVSTSFMNCGFLVPTSMGDEVRAGFETTVKASVQVWKDGFEGPSETGAPGRADPPFEDALNQGYAALVSKSFGVAVAADGAPEAMQRLKKAIEIANHWKADAKDVMNRHR